MATVKSSFTFSPQVRTDHMMAYFILQLVWGRLANKGIKDFQQAQGETITFPYFKKIGAATDGTENTAVSLDTLGDASFTATVKEVVKGVSITDTARIAAGMSPDKWDDEAVRQIARVNAEKLEADLLAEISKTGNHLSVRSVSDTTITSAFDATKGVASLDSQKLDIRKLSTDRIAAFGDRADEIEAIVMHSSCYNDLAIDTTAGFLKADANHPLFNVRGFKGEFAFGAVLIVNDNVPAGEVTVTDSSNATQKYVTRNVVYLKKNAFAFIVKRTPKIEEDRDIEKRIDKMVSTQWYAVKSFHNQKTNQNDKRIAFAEYPTSEKKT